MIRTRTARRIAAAAAFGGGGVGLLTGALAAVLYTEAKIARRTVGEPDGEPPTADGVYGDLPGDLIRLAVIGDSSAAGLGVADPMRTPGALLACGLAAVAERPVHLTNVAKSGAQSGDLERQVTLALAAEPDVAMIMVGANDVTHQVRPADSVRRLEQATRRLIASGCEVVVGTCPDLGTIEPIAQPLRYLARQWSRSLAAAQTIAVVEAGGRTVSIGALLGPEFAARPGDLFGPDRFHPSEEGYSTAAMALLPSVCAALDLWPLDEERPDSFRGEGVLPVAVAAVEAVEEGGTEVAGTQVAGSERGPRGRWALLRHRRRQRIPAPTPGQGAPGEEQPADGDSPAAGPDEERAEAARTGRVS
ncbi:SGNH/GDSL hydrolase family protein [Yinghuangia seranimata]|uniref:SGNH/GDSL hydrolase family protein n=1 Tax=Yinghuangia seranimata TaxID=408067 RepID=UPI00248B243C|nr:SGNH/GDSL hydrolase family protein [Yinghuangia seranimata]MDI2128808.1 SGNH/GDSL hydrolase family protein [Yinghuangia seranimata]